MIQPERNSFDPPRGMLASKSSSYVDSARVQSKITLLSPQSNLCWYLLSKNSIILLPEVATEWNPTHG